jgi:hypothetical protein
MRPKHPVLSLVPVTLCSAALLAQPFPASSKPIKEASARPDLKVGVELRKEQRRGKWYVRIRFTVINRGLAPAPPSVLGSWCHADAGGPCPALDGDYDIGPAVESGATGVLRLATPAIPSGGDVFVLGPNTKDWRSGRYTITARADVLGALAETTKANNRGSATIAIP